MNRKIRIAIQKKGRLMEQSLEYLKSLGLKFEKSEKIITEYKDIELLRVRCSDIPTYLEQGVADFGIVGRNLLVEKPTNVEILENLEFGKCSLIIVAPKKNKCMQGERIATSYPKTLKKYLRKNSINASIIEIKGSVEATPALGLADTICDITQAGKTLKENGLEIKEVILKSQAVLIGKSPSLWKSITSKK